MDSSLGSFCQGSQRVRYALLKSFIRINYSLWQHNAFESCLHIQIQLKVTITRDVRSATNISFESLPSTVLRTDAF